MRLNVLEVTSNNSNQFSHVCLNSIDFDQKYLIFKHTCAKIKESRETKKSLPLARQDTVRMAHNEREYIMKQQAAVFSDYFYYAVSKIIFKHRHNAKTEQSVDFAIVISSTGNKTYAVGIEDGHAIWCECGHHVHRNAYCKHMETVDYRLYMDQQAAQFRSYDVITDALSVVVNASLGDAYEQLAKTKKPAQFAWGSCGHRVKPGHAGELCGGCQ